MNEDRHTIIKLVKMLAKEGFTGIYSYTESFNTLTEKTVKTYGIDGWFENNKEHQDHFETADLKEIISRLKSCLADIRVKRLADGAFFWSE